MDDAKPVVNQVEELQIIVHEMEVEGMGFANPTGGVAGIPAQQKRCRDNLYQVRTIVDHQIRWSTIFTPIHKHKSSVQNIILKYYKDSNIVNKEGGKTLAEFPNNIELGKLGPDQDPNNKEHSTTSLV
ncbi:hypothetical protein Tco_1092205 [Tanacetum coccineum]|uniref:Uncharacterized protein n=1 Tax=Tanacetum coccineum TaxID=301880 RepID=A0ABQ5IB51_9ASTR